MITLRIYFFSILFRNITGESGIGLSTPPEISYQITKITKNHCTERFDNSSSVRQLNQLDRFNIYGFLGAQYIKANHL